MALSPATTATERTRLVSVASGSRGGSMAFDPPPLPPIGQTVYAESSLDRTSSCRVHTQPPTVDAALLERVHAAFADVGTTPGRVVRWALQLRDMLLPPRSQPTVALHAADFAWCLFVLHSAFGTQGAQRTCRLSAAASQVVSADDDIPALRQAIRVMEKVVGAAGHVARLHLFGVIDVGYAETAEVPDAFGDVEVDAPADVPLSPSTRYESAASVLALVVVDLRTMPAVRSLEVTGCRIEGWRGGDDLARVVLRDTVVAAEALHAFQASLVHRPFDVRKADVVLHVTRALSREAIVRIGADVTSLVVDATHGTNSGLLRDARGGAERRVALPNMSSARRPWARLETLVCDNAAVSDIDESLAVAPILANLGLSGNRIRQLSAASPWNRLSTVVKLCLRANQLRRIEALPPQIEFLDVTSNCLTAEALGAITSASLVHLIADDNEVRRLAPLRLLRTSIPQLGSISLLRNPLCAACDLADDVFACHVARAVAAEHSPSIVVNGWTVPARYASGGSFEVAASEPLLDVEPGTPRTPEHGLVTPQLVEAALTTSPRRRSSGRKRVKRRVDRATPAPTAVDEFCDMARQPLASGDSALAEDMADDCVEGWTTEGPYGPTVRSLGAFVHDALAGAGFADYEQRFAIVPFEAAATALCGLNRADAEVAAPQFEVWIGRSRAPSAAKRRSLLPYRGAARLLRVDETRGACTTLSIIAGQERVAGGCLEHPLPGARCVVAHPVELSVSRGYDAPALDRLPPCVAPVRSACVAVFVCPNDAAARALQRAAERSLSDSAIHLRAPQCARPWPLLRNVRCDAVLETPSLALGVGWPSCEDAQRDLLAATRAGLQCQRDPLLATRAVLPLPPEDRFNAGVQHTTVECSAFVTASWDADLTPAAVQLVVACEQVVLFDDDGFTAYSQTLAARPGPLVQRISLPLAHVTTVFVALGGAIVVVDRGGAAPIVIHAGGAGCASDVAAAMVRAAPHLDGRVAFDPFPQRLAQELLLRDVTGETTFVCGLAWMWFLRRPGSSARHEVSAPGVVGSVVAALPPAFTATAADADLVVWGPEGELSVCNAAAAIHEVVLSETQREQVRSPAVDVPVYATASDVLAVAATSVVCNDLPPCVYFKYGMPRASSAALGASELGEAASAHVLLAFSHVSAQQSFLAALQVARRRAEVAPLEVESLSRDDVIRTVPVRESTQW